MIATSLTTDPRCPVCEEDIRWSPRVFCYFCRELVHHATSYTEDGEHTCTRVVDLPMTTPYRAFRVRQHVCLNCFAGDDQMTYLMQDKEIGFARAPTFLVMEQGVCVCHCCEESAEGSVTHYPDSDRLVAYSFCAWCHLVVHPDCRRLQRRSVQILADTVCDDCVEGDD